MENEKTTVTPQTSAPPSMAPNIDKRPIIGFLLMLAGPALIIGSVLIVNATSWYFPKVVAYIITWIAVLLPGAGAIFAIITLVKRKETGSDRSLAVVTLVMCNPIFYFFYFFLCIGIGHQVLANLSWM